MLVLGIDPGLAATGYGLVREKANDLALITCGVITTKAHTDVGERLRILHVRLEELIRQYAPDAAAVEELFFSSNARTAMLVGEARGAIVLTLAMSGVATYGYTPLQVKQATTGYGGAPKAQVQNMVRMLLNLDHVPRPDDAADAVATAICHLHSIRLTRVLDQRDAEGDR